MMVKLRIRLKTLTNANSVIVEVVLVSRLRAIGQSSLLIRTKESSRFSHECDLLKDPVRPDIVGTIAESSWRRIGLHLVVIYLCSFPNLEVCSEIDDFNVLILLFVSYQFIYLFNVIFTHEMQVKKLVGY
jgi:hypothetical protein